MKQNTTRSVLIIWLVTISLAMVSLWLNSPLVLLASVLCTGAIWHWHWHHAPKNHHDVVRIIKHFHLLKKFSGEIQSTIHEELELVIFDVTRIQSVVSDSMGILLSSIENIRHIAQGNVEKINYHDVNIQDKLVEASDNLHSAEKIIESIDKFSHQINLLSSNLQIDNASTATEKMAVGDISRTSTNLYQTSNDINQQSQLLQKQLSNSFDSLKSALNESQLVVGNNLSETSLCLSGEMKKEIDDNIGKITQALQFEDIVCQISERVAKHIEDIRYLVKLSTDLHDSELSEDFLEKLDFSKQELERIKQKLATSSTRSIVGQSSMDEGDIELF